MSRMYGFVRSRQLEGTYPGSPAEGVWISTTMRVMKGWGILEEALWPYDHEGNWPPTEPEGVDSQAKAHRVFAYQRANTVKQCRFLLAYHSPLVASFEIDDSWLTPPKGIIPAPDDQPVSGVHTVCLVGYDDNRQQFRFINSWGADWGDAGFGYLPSSYFEERFLEGWVVIDFDPRRPPGKRDGIYLRMWGITDPFGRILHGAELIDSADDENVGWGFAIVLPELLVLEELFVRPNWRMRGHGSQLADVFTQLAGRIGADLWAWIPHSDVGEENRPALTGILRHLGLSRTRSPVRWAAAAEP